MASHFFGAKGFWLSYYYCNGRAWQSFEPFVDYWVEQDVANRRYRIVGNFKVRASWTGNTQLTLRNLSATIGSNTYSAANYSVSGYKASRDWDTGPWNVASQWYSYNTNGQPSVTNIPMKFYFCYTHYTTTNCAGAVSDCFGPSSTVGVNVSSIPAIQPAYSDPATPSLSCKPKAGSYSIGQVTASVSTYGYGTGSNSMKAELSTSSSFASIAQTKTSTATSATFEFSSLQPNTRYYTRVTASNGRTSKNSTCNFVTLAGSSLASATAVDWQTGTVRLTVQNGGGVYNPTTTIWVKPCNGGDWVQKASSTTKTQATISLSGLNEQTCYQVQARTATTAGTYTSNTVQFTTPKKKSATAKFTKLNSEIDNETYVTSAELCYEYTGNTTPVWITVFYRVKGGFDPTWLVAGEERKEFNTESGKYCVTATDLFPNLTEYETYIKVETEDLTWNSQVSTFVTPLLPQPENFNCENFKYLLDLLCQAVTALYNGNKKIYANPATKENCDPDSENPTMATLWSRMLRFDHAVACLLCNMVDIVLKSGLPGQYYVGEAGWTYLSKEAAEGVEEIIESGATYNAIEELVHSVWHFHESVSYLVSTKSDLDDLEDAAEGDVALVDDESCYYDYKNGAWVKGKAHKKENFAIHHVNKESYSALGHVMAESAWYWFEGSWNSLDADTKWLEDHLEEMSSRPYVQKQDEKEDDITLRVVKEGFSYDLLPTGKRIVCFVTEEIPQPSDDEKKSGSEEVE